MILLAHIGPLCIAVKIYYWVLLARVLLSWIPTLPDGLKPVVDVVYFLTEPVVRWARPLIPPLRIGAVALDMSILLVFFLVLLVSYVVC
ncbi:MAG: YggT family protein [Actinomycetota bacterium]